MIDSNKEFLPGLSVVIPCYKSAMILPKLVEELSNVMESLKQERELPYEIILVVDGSPDNTYEIASNLPKTVPNVKAFELTRNFGQHAAIFAGIERVKYDLILTMDDDGQHPPAEIHKLLDALTDAIDVVYGVATRRKDSLMRHFATRLAKFTTFKLLGINNVRDISAFRLFRTDLVRSIELRNFPNAIVDVILFWNTMRFNSVKVHTLNRKFGTSNYNFSSLVRFSVKMIMGYSLRPLRLVSSVGFVTFLVSIGMGVYYLFAKLNGSITVPGYSSTIIAIFIFTSVQLLTLGLIGEYIGVIYERSMGKPSYEFRKSPIKSLPISEQTLG